MPVTFVGGSPNGLGSDLSVVQRAPVVTAVTRNNRSLPFDRENSKKVVQTVVPLSSINLEGQRVGQIIDTEA
jgi:hypothetical protein